MRYSFTKKDVFFSRNGLAGEAREERRGKRRMKKEEDAIVTQATAAQCG